MVAALLPFVWVGLGNPRATAQNIKPDELTTQETAPAFKVQVERNMVVVRVIVRDAHGVPVPTLRKEDFALFDNGKPQTISQFSVETADTSPTAPHPAPTAPAVPAEEEGEGATPAPQRYLALYFDDVHTDFEGIARTRAAAAKYLAASATPEDRIGIFTSSGQGNLDFTDDRNKLREALLRLLPRSVGQPRQADPCPDISDYQAYLIVERNDEPSLEEAAEQVLACRYNGDRKYYTQALQDAQAFAVYTLRNAEFTTEYSLQGLNGLLQRLATLPGRRTIVLVSPGFFTETQRYEIGELTDRALRANVIINALQSRGLYAEPPLGDVTERYPQVVNRPDLVGIKAQNMVQAASLNDQVLMTLAADTGGVFFQNSNDFDEGFREVGAMPAVTYVLAFSPQPLKYDGRFHNLRVKLTNGQKYALQARRGYFAPRQPADAAELAKEEIREAIYSQDQLNGLPMAIQTQFFKVNELDAKLSVLMHLDLRFVPFRKAEGRNLDSLTIVTVLFDRDGNYLSGQEKRLDFKLFDSSLARLNQTGLTLRTSFDVKPGTYMVRQVVRDSEGQRLSGQTRTVEIPY